MVDWAWWFALLGGFALGFVVAALTTAKMWAVSRMLDRPLAEIETRRWRSVPLPRERQVHSN